MPESSSQRSARLQEENVRLMATNAELNATIASLGETLAQLQDQLRGYLPVPGYNSVSSAVSSIASGSGHDSFAALTLRRHS